MKLTLLSKKVLADLQIILILLIERLNNAERQKPNGEGVKQ
ncbi:hypothetical protein [Brachyspira sp.]